MNNPCISCAIGFEDSCMCEKKSVYEAYNKGKADILKNIDIDKFKNLTDSDRVFIVNGEWVESITEQVRAEERAKTIDECKEVLRQHWLNGTVAYRIIDEINRSLEQLKE